MGMQSLALLSGLEKLPALEKPLAKGEFLPEIRAMDRDQFAVEVSLATEETLEGLFDWQNVDDDLTEGYHKAFERIAEQGTSLAERYSEKVEEGPKAVEGFVNNLKGKVAELKSQQLIEEQLPPGSKVDLASSPIQEGWDITATLPDGEEILVQVKTLTGESAGKVVDAMQESPNIAFAVSSEIYSSVAQSNPELVGRILDIGPNAELTESVKDGLDKLASNHGIDVPDSIGGAIPFIDELVSGVFLIRDMIGTERELVGVDLSDRKRVHGIRALVFLARFGVRKVCIAAGIGLGGFLGIHRAYPWEHSWSSIWFYWRYVNSKKIELPAQISHREICNQFRWWGFGGPFLLDEQARD